MRWRGIKVVSFARYGVVRRIGQQNDRSVLVGKIVTGHGYSVGGQGRILIRRSRVDTRFRDVNIRGFPKHPSDNQNNRQREQHNRADQGRRLAPTPSLLLNVILSVHVAKKCSRSLGLRHRSGTAKNHILPSFRDIPAVAHAAFNRDALGHIERLEGVRPNIKRHKLPP